MTNSTATSAFSMGPLGRTDFTSEQDRANEFAKSLQNQQIVVPAPDQTGSLKKTLQSFPLAQGITEFDTGLDLRSAILQVATTEYDAVIGIQGISTKVGSNLPGVVNFDGATPDTSYTLYVTTFSQ